MLGRGDPPEGAYCVRAMDATSSIAMILNLTPVSEDDAYVEWGRAEMPSPRWRGQAPAHLVTKLESSGELTTEERAETAAFMRSHRTEVGDWFKANGRTLDWFRGDLPLPEIGDVLVDGYWPSVAYKQGWAEPIPRTVAEFAAHPSAQALTIQGSFRWGTARGRPILVGPDRAGPWLIAEGSNRLRAMWRAREMPDAPAHVPVVVGVHPEALGWKNSDVLHALATIRWAPRRTVRVAVKGDQQVVFCIETTLSARITKRCFGGFLQQQAPIEPNPPDWVWTPTT